MGESIVETPIVNIKMGESIVSCPTLEVSVSFGRFENDALSWERWSTFSPNKYLEEVEKCSTPGSVAQKKAYFEAHYKKIAARKLEQLEQEKQQLEQEQQHLEQEQQQLEHEKQQLEQKEQVESLPPRVSVFQFQDHIEYTEVSDSHFDVSSDERSATESEEQRTKIDVKNCDFVDEPKDDASVDKEVNSLSSVKPKEGILETRTDPVEILKVEEQCLERGSQDSQEDIKHVECEAQNSPVQKNKAPKPYLKDTARKIHPTSENRISAGPKKKPAIKSSRTPTPASKPAPTYKVISPSQPTVKKVNGMSFERNNRTPLAQSKRVVPGSLMSPSHSSTRKSNGSTLQRSMNSPVLVNKKVAPISLHMSLSLDPPNSTASTTMRKSLFMEKMGDKEIVKRAFKTFANSLNQGKCAGDMRYSGSEQVLFKGSEPKSSTSLTPTKEGERLRKATDKAITQKGQLGTRSTFLPSRAPKDDGIERKKVNTIRPSGLRTDRSANKWEKEITKAEVNRPGSNR